MGAPFALAGTVPSLPALLQPGEELTATIEFTATVGLSTRTISAVATLPCLITADAVVQGTGTTIGGTTTIALASLTAAPGQRVRLPMTMIASGLIAPGSTSSYRATLRFNRTLLIPVTPPIADTITGNDRLLTFAGQSGASGTSGTIATIEFTAALGDTLVTPIVIDSFAWNDPTVAVTTSNSVFTLSDICS